MNKEEKLNLNAGDYAIRHCIIDQTYNGLEVHKMLCDAYIAGNNDTLDDEDERIRKELLEHCKNQAEPYIQTGNKCPQIQSWIAWLEKQGELPIYNIPLKEVILSIWDLGNEWKELTNGCISTEYGTQLDYIQKHWQESEYYLRAMQDEQKPTDKIEPKFKVGDWIVQKGLGIYKIVEVCESWYEVISYKDGIQYSIGFDKENDCHLWTIQDARDGDVLATLNHILIFEKILPKDGGVSYCHYDFGSSTPQFDFNRDGGWYFGKEAKVYPATKEQRALLFQKMNEAGYEWDANKKKLKEIEKPTDVRTTGYWHVEDIEQKPTDEEMKRLLQTEYEKGRADAIADMQMEWSEEDEKMINHIISIIEDADDNLIRAENISIYTNWFKSLKDRVKPKQKWSEEDERMYRELHNLIYSTSYCDSRKEFSDFLNSLKDRVQIKPQQEWSEEDNYYRNHIIQIIEEINNAPLKRREDWESYINWLKSLGPQNHWKPSDEQMKALNYVVNLMASSESPKENDYYYNVFKDLRKQLKKLKEGEV